MKNLLNRNPKLKKTMLRLVFNPRTARTRLWVRVFIYPFVIKKGKHSKIRSSVRLDLNPNNKFQIGSGSIIESGAIINNGIGDIVIGDNSMITCRAMILAPAIIGNNVVVGISSQVLGLTHDFNDISLSVKEQSVSGTQVTIKDGAWIGGNCCILQGVTIGEHSLVGAGSVVNKDVPPYSVAVGNPARVIKRYDFDKKEWVRVER